MPFSAVGNSVFRAATSPERRIDQLQKKFGNKVRTRDISSTPTTRQTADGTSDLLNNPGAARPSEALIRAKIVDPRVNYRVRLFISSTFKDMVDERDELVKRVLPKMHKFCEDNHIFFSYVDLRWGITTEDTNAGRTIDLCMESIDNCRPYFMCLLGDRYGWCQDKTENDPLLCKTFDLASKKYPWVQAFRDRSLTELEVLYSSLFYPHLSPNSLFFCRKNKKVCLDEDASAKQKLESLKARIASVYPVKYYEDVSVLGNQVYADFCAAIIKDFHLQPSGIERVVEVSVKDQKEDATHRYIARQHAQMYIASTAKTYFSQLDAFVNGPGGQFLMCNGLGGCGKSALLLSWSEHRQQGDDLVILHTVSATSTSNVHTNILARMTRILDHKYNLAAIHAEDDNSVEHVFKTVLAIAGAVAKARGHKIIIVLDGLDQLVPSSAAARLTWIPRVLPTSVYVIGSASVTNFTFKIASDRGCVKMSIEPLNLVEQHALIENYLAKYSKRLTSAQTALVTGTGKWTCNPMFLTTLLAELRLASSFENLETDISHYTGAKITQELYGLIFARWEKDVGLPVITEIVSLLGCSRNGLTPAELQALLRSSGFALDGPAWQAVLSTISGSHCSAIQLQNDFLHVANKRAKKAVVQRYLTGDKVQQTHEKLISFFRGKSFVPEERRTVELAFSLFKCQNSAELHTLLSSPDTGLVLFDQLCVGDRFDLLRYWRLCEPDPLRIENVYLGLLELKERGSDRPHWSDLLQRLGYYLERLTCFDGATQVWERKLKLDRSLYGSDDLRLAVSLCALASCYEKRDRLDEADQAAQQAHRLRAKTFGENHAQTAQVSMMLAMINKRKGHYKNAAQIYKNLMANAEIIFGAEYLHHPEYARLLEGDGDVCRKEARYGEALELYTKANAINEQFHGEAHPSCSRTLKNIALIHKKQGNYTLAETLYRKCLTITLPLCGEKHADTGKIINELADVLRKNGNIDAAETMYKRSLAITESLLGENHIDVVQTIMDLALISKKRGLYAQAQASYEKCLGIVERTLGTNHYKYAELLNQLGDVHRKLSHFDKALELYRTALAINKATLGLTHIEVGETLNNIGLILKKNAQYDEAESCFSQAIEIAERDRGDENYKVGLFLNNLADVYRKRGKFHLASADYARAIKITEKTLGPSNVELAEPLLGLANANKKLGFYEESEPLLLRAAGIIFLNFNTKHPKMALILHSLADVHRKGVTQLELQCLSADEESSNQRHELPGLRSRVAATRAKAKMLYIRALRINEQALGLGDIEVAENLRGLASLCKDTDSKEAKVNIDRAVAIVTDKLGVQHTKYAEFVNEQAEVVLAGGDYPRAKKLYQQALDQNTKAFGLRHPEVAHAEHGLGLCLLAEGKKTEALAVLTQAAKLTEATLGPLHLALATRLLSVAKAHQALGDNSEAKEVRQTVFRNFGSLLSQTLHDYSHNWVYSDKWDDEKAPFAKSNTLRLPPPNMSEAVVKSLGQGFSAVQAAVLDACAKQVPRRDPVVPREWRVVTQKRSEAKESEHNITVMQFNTLAEGLSAGWDACPPFPAEKIGDFGGFDAIPCPLDVFRFTDRRMRIIAEILSVDPDILALEETDHFVDWYQPVLAAAGYTGVFSPKGLSPCLELGFYSDGVALFWKSSEFELVSSKQLSSLPGDDGQPLKIVHLLAVLKHLKSSWPVAVAVCHLKSKKGIKEEAYRTSQVTGVMKGLTQCVRDQNCAHSVLMGDFNASPLDQKDYKATAVKAVEAWKLPQLASAYPLPTSSSDPIWSTWKKRGDNEVKQLIDYIFLSPHCRPTAVLSAPHSSDLDPWRLPGLRYPSDHLAIATQVTLLHP